MNKRGFTLIELLAVIVVLAIIVLIATPIVMNVIKNVQKGSAERSTERYLTAVEQSIATDRLENDLIVDGTYTVNIDGNLVSDDKTLTIEVNGDRPLAGSKISIKNGQVVSNGTSLTIGNYKVTIDDKGVATATPASNEDVVKVCTAIAPTNQNVWNRTNNVVESIPVGFQATASAPYKLGSVYSCDLGDGAKTFYVLKVSKNNVKLIMNENLGKTVAWAESGNTTAGPVTAKAALEDRTSKWTKLRSAGGIVDLPEAQDIADAMGDTKWTDNKYSGTLGPDWMKTNLTGNKAPYAYWTSTRYSRNATQAWRVDYGARLRETDIVSDTARGVRPVITILKANMSL